MKQKIKKVKRIADKKYDGHFTIYSFTNHYKGCFGTIMDGGENNTVRDQINKMPKFFSLSNLLNYLIQNETKNEYDNEQGLQSGG